MQHDPAFVGQFCSTGNTAEKINVMACTLAPITDCECCCPTYEAPTVRALTVRQPFAGLIAYGNKTLEIRSRRTNHRGQLLICAGANEYDGQMIDPDVPGRVVSCDRYLRDVRAYSPAVDMFPVGVAVALVELVNCRPMTPDDAGVRVLNSDRGCLPGNLKTRC